jgi:hypothetical protein
VLTPLLLGLSLLAPPAKVPPPGIAPGQVAKLQVRYVEGRRLLKQADGSWKYADRQRGFEASIAPDGQLSFDGIQYPGEGHRWTPYDRDPYTGRSARRSPIASYSNSTKGDAGSALLSIASAIVWGAIESNGKTRNTKRPSANEPIDAKRRFALDTAAFRTELVTDWYEDRLRTSLAKLDADIQSLTGDHLSAKTQRLALFELWRSFERTLPEAPLHPPPSTRTRLDQSRAEVGALGRESIVTFIKTYLRRGTAAGYGRIELRKLNERPGLPEPFAPYGSTLAR